MQSLVMSALAMAMLMKSSEIEGSEVGRQRAIIWRNGAQSALEAACTGPLEQMDYTLAEAALVGVSSACGPLVFIG